jgi:DNA repair protein RadC
MCKIGSSNNQESVNILSPPIKKWDQLINHPANSIGTTFVVPVYPRNPTVRAQNRGIQSVSLELSELWLRELEKQYPEP